MGSGLTVIGNLQEALFVGLQHQLLGQHGIGIGDILARMGAQVLDNFACLVNELDVARTPSVDPVLLVPDNQVKVV